jgi:GNAT superfamily N-acetyltransferase
METSVVTSIDSPAFRAAVDHRHALIAEVEGLDWDERYPGWRARYASFYAESFELGTAALIAYDRNSGYGGSCMASVQREFRSAIMGQGIGYLNGLYVLPDLRNRHVGSLLVRAALLWLNAHGCPIVRLHPSQTSNAFYRRLGFRPVQEFEYGEARR